MSSTGETAGLITTSSPDGDVGDRARRPPRPRRRRRSPGTCGSGGLGMPRVTHRSMWFRALATTRTCTSSAPRSGSSIVPQRYAPGDSSRIQRSSPSPVHRSHADRVGVGFDPHDEVAALPHVDAVEPHVLARSQLPSSRSTASAVGDRRVRHVRPVRQAARAPAIAGATPIARVHLDDVDAPVVRVATRARRPSRPRYCRVHDRDESSRATTTAGRRACGDEPGDATVEERRSRGRPRR